MRRTGNIIWGIFLILIGILFILGRFYDSRFLDMAVLWPLFILVPGLIFELSYFFSRKNPGLLVPGGILTTIGTIFLLNTILGNYIIHYLWPFFPMSVAIGLFQLYLFTEKPWGLLIPIGIIGGVSVVLLASVLMDMPAGIIFLAAAFIITGLLIIFRGNFKKEQ